MTELFGQYRATYNRAVDDSIRFSGPARNFFLQAKLGPFAKVIAERGVAKDDGSVRALEDGRFLMFPFANSVAHKVEGWLSQLPLGAQYVCSGRV